MKAEELRQVTSQAEEKARNAGRYALGAEADVTGFKDHLKQHWPAIKASLLAGSCIPSPVRRVDIPKPQGGTRALGIPALTDRLIQQALHQLPASARHN